MSRALVFVTVIALCAIAPGLVAAQKTVVEPREPLTTTAVIQKIDPAGRFVFLRGDAGTDLRVFVPPEFTRFGELRVADHVTITYYQSTVYQLKGPHQPRPAVAEEVGAAESASALPGATFSQQVTERVTVKAVDRQGASITVTGLSGQTVVRRVSRPADLDGVRKGDHIDITYTEAVLATVTRPE